ncbi:MAG: radical SAM protein [Anaerolineales bacterium]|nr:radical SAM protein [Anaerolineales bacterium]
MQAPEGNSILEYTESLCPICLKVVEARTIVQDGAVYLKKVCPDHGPCTTYLWPEAEHFRWMNSFRLPFKQPRFEMPTSKGCPSDCGLCSIHLRQSTLVEVEVTQRCNLRCPVCFMSAGEAPQDPSLGTLRAMFEKILRQTGPQVSLQLTGGEPTVRRELAEIVRLGRAAGFSAIEVNTNGLVIGRDPAYIRELAEAGISGIYLQFDGLTEAVYEKIRGADLLKDKLQAVENCRAAGVQVVLAMTVIWSVNHDQLGAVLNYALQNQDVIAGVALQPAFTSGRFDVEAARRLTMGDVVFMLSEQSGGLIDPYDLWPLGCSHPLCSCATYLVEEAGEVKPFTRLITPQEYMREFSADSPQGSVFADIAARRFPELRPGLSVVIMNYMDAMSVDLKRLKECSMTVTMEDGRLIPFCAYQMTDIYGSRLYPVWGRVDQRLLTERAYD